MRDALKSIMVGALIAISIVLTVQVFIWLWPYVGHIVIGVLVLGVLWLLGECARIAVDPK